MLENKSKLDALNSNYEKLKSEHGIINEMLCGLNKKKTEAASQLEEKKNEYNHSQSRLKMLKELENDYEGYAKSVKTVLNAHRSGSLKCAVNGALSELIKVDKKYVTAIEIALGGALQNIVVDTTNDAKQAIEYLKKASAGRATFLPVSSVSGRLLDNLAQISKQSGYIGLGSELVAYDSKYDGIIKNLLGRTVIVDNIDNGIAISSKFSNSFRIVTLGGDVFNTGGSMSGGSINKATGILSRASQIDELTKSIEALKKQVEADQKLVNDIEASINNKAEKAQVLLEEIRSGEQQIIRLKADCEHSALLKQSASDALNNLNVEAKALFEQITDANDQIAIIINQSTRDELDIESLQGEVLEKQESVLKIEQEREEVNAQLMEKSVGLNSVKKDIEALSMRISEANADIKEASNAIELRKSDIIELDKAMGELVIKEALKQSEIGETHNRIKELEAASAKLLQQRKDTQDDIADKNLLSKELMQKVFVLKEEQNRIENKRIKMQMEVENTSTSLWDDYELTYSTALEYKKEGFDNATAGRRINELRSEIKALGNVNVDAIEEYKSVSERYEFLTNQINDLEHAKISIRKLIDDITLQMEKQFAEQFEVINKNFSIVFEQLFGGGRAELRLSDPTDILESGIEIDAQPPGKKLQSLSLLSGGEKAFTAIALLFAILKVRPTPFCILDEIEAALDEPNVYRFADYLKDYSKNTQFVIVTHRRGTMEAADLLYGVTMQEQGVSKLLSLKIEDVDNL